MKKNEIILFESGDHAVSLPVNTDGETVWLALDQIAALFERDKSTISRHIRNVFSEGELRMYNIKWFLPFAKFFKEEV